MTGTAKYKDLIRHAGNLHSGATNISEDVLEAETADDLFAINSHLEILERNVRAMRDAVNAAINADAEV